MYDTNTNNLRFNTLKSLIDGFSFECISSFSQIDLAIYRLAEFLEGIWTTEDFTLVLNACKTNEKFVYLLFYPYLLKPLGEVIWPTLLVHFNYVYGSFSKFMAKVSSFLKKGNVLTHTIRTISINYKNSKINLRLW